MYGIKLPVGRYIDWCDEHWYETVARKKLQYTLEQAMKVIQQMVNHFNYHVILVSEDGDEVEYDFGKKRVTPAPVAKVTQEVAVGDYLLF